MLSLFLGRSHNAHTKQRRYTKCTTMYKKICTYGKTKAKLLRKCPLYPFFRRRSWPNRQSRDWLDEPFGRWCVANRATSADHYKHKHMPRSRRTKYWCVISTWCWFGKVVTAVVTSIHWRARLVLVLMIFWWVNRSSNHPGHSAWPSLRG